MQTYLKESVPPSSDDSPSKDSPWMRMVILMCAFSLGSVVRAVSNFHLLVSFIELQVMYLMYPLQKITWGREKYLMPTLGRTSLALSLDLAGARRISI